MSMKTDTSMGMNTDGSIGMNTDTSCDVEPLVDSTHQYVLNMIAGGLSQAEHLDISSVVRSIEPLADFHTVEQVVKRVAARVQGLGPIEPLISDPNISEVMINGPGSVWVERDGATYRSDVFLSDTAISLLIEQIVGPLGRRVDQHTPYVDGRLPDGSRVHVVVPPVAVDGPYITIRRFVVPDVGLEMFAGQEVVVLLEQLVARGANLVVSGGTGAGKTTLLNALATCVNSCERVITIEDAAELQFDHPHVVRLEARPQSREGTGVVTIRDLVRNALRMRPDRLVVGEVRGSEALDLLHALNTGHAGCLSTVHANGPADALRRLTTLATTAGERLPVEAIREYLTSAIDVVVHVERRVDGTRFISTLAEVVSHDEVRVLADGENVLSSMTRPARLSTSHLPTARLSTACQSTAFS